MDATDTFRVPPGQRQLFLDEIGVQGIDKLVKTLHQPEKKGAVIRSPDPRQTIQTRNAPFWDPASACYKLWVTSMDNASRQSVDGLHWIEGEKPVFDLGISMVVYDGNDPDPQRRYKAVLLNQGFAVSGDGVHWRKLEVPPIQSQDEGNFTYNAADGRFIHSLKRSGPYGRSVVVATSTDFEHWDDYGVVFHTDEQDQALGREAIAVRLANPTLRQTEFNTPEHYSVQVYNMGVFGYEGIYIGLPSIYHHTGKVSPEWDGFKSLRLSPYIRECIEQHGDYTGFYTVQVTCSRDLKHWTRVGQRRPFIEASPLGAGAYDLQTIIGPSNPVVRDDELWFYYTGIKQYAFITSGGEEGYDDYVGDKGAVCLAVLRRDGFVSLDAGAEQGRVTTALLALEGRELWVNLDAPKGTLVVEVLDANDRLVARSVVFNGDQVRGKLDWEAGDFGALMGQVVRLRFMLCDARLYSYWIE